VALVAADQVQAQQILGLAHRGKGSQADLPPAQLPDQAVAGVLAPLELMELVLRPVVADLVARLQLRVQQFFMRAAAAEGVEQILG
jgi:hypothetical protein